jgi:hypothetical protein
MIGVGKLWKELWITAQKEERRKVKEKFDGEGKYAIEVCDKNGYEVFTEREMGLMSLRVFCEQKMYPNLAKGKWQTISIQREEKI